MPTWPLQTRQDVRDSSPRQGRTSSEREIITAGLLTVGCGQRSKGGKVHEGYRTAILKQHVQALEAGEKDAGPEGHGEVEHS